MREQSITLLSDSGIKARGKNQRLQVQKIKRSKNTLHHLSLERQGELAVSSPGGLGRNKTQEQKGKKNATIKQQNSDPPPCSDEGSEVCDQQREDCEKRRLGYE